ncbi:helix-turn-helix domain-containing protein [Cohnella sp. WQ 127256]|uniref:helix-turn-helix domain-containing protein n=1 Tax=Cohnella sp. WQ 127256 TaxID=2938790 RepID=UPI00211920A9|nr:helix-turn-helix domain-containing protein [Cohnella sp. WQ 127256]
MYSLLIVDDEIYAVNGIKSGLDWSIMGFTSVYEAYDRAMAQDIISSTPIDVMICDIEMPGSSGLDLLEWINEQGFSIETVFLTCHSNFSYVQRALQLGSLNYLIKPVEFIQLEGIVLKALNNIARENEVNYTQKEYHKYLQLWEIQKPLLVERFWQELLDQRNSFTESWINRELAQYEKELSSDSRVFPILISIEKWLKEISTKDEEVMEYALRNAAEEIILGQNPGVVFQDRDGMIVIVFYEGSILPIQERIRRCELYVDSCTRYFFSTVTCYLGKEIEIRNLQTMHRALQFTEQNNVRRTPKVICYLDDTADQSGPTHLLPDFFMWAELLEQGRVEQLRVVMVESFARMEDEKSLRMATLHAFFHGMLQMMHYLLHKKGMFAPLQQGEMLLEKEMATRSVRGLQAWAEQALEQFAEALHSGQEDYSLIDKAKQYISEHLREDVSREQIADHVFLNPGYLSRLFKKETGESLSDYILRERMVLAKSALAYSDEPISKVARSLGYNSLSYFGKMFKRIYQLSPQDYRRNGNETERSGL